MDRGLEMEARETRKRFTEEHHYVSRMLRAVGLDLSPVEALPILMGPT
jgi:uncharacterized ferritin-like protein (DUF455 family)